MTTGDALDKQIDIYRGLTGEEHLKIALDLHAFACDVSRAGIRRRYPDADDEEVERRLRQRLEQARR